MDYKRYGWTAVMLPAEFAESFIGAPITQQLANEFSARLREKLEEFERIRSCLVDPMQRVPGKTMERVQELLAEVKALHAQLDDKWKDVQELRAYTGSFEAMEKLNDVPDGTVFLVQEQHTHGNTLYYRLNGVWRDARGFRA
jgi:hypothetical protein